jgi:hypothetical protein
MHNERPFFNLCHPRDIHSSPSACSSKTGRNHKIETQPRTTSLMDCVSMQRIRFPPKAFLRVLLSGLNRRSCRRSWYRSSKLINFDVLNDAAENGGVTKYRGRVSAGKRSFIRQSDCEMKVWRWSIAVD